MSSVTRSRFGVFEFDPATLELRKSGRAVRLRPQGLKLLKLLVSRPREVISREEIAQFLWNSGVFVDFEQGVNHVIKQVRAALGDDAESPRYIETLPRRGYRFIAPVEGLVEPKEAPVRADGTEPPRRLERYATEDPERTAEIADGRLEVNASTSLSQSAPRALIGRLERHRIAIATITCAVLSFLGVGLWATFRPPVSSSTVRSVAVLPFNTIGGGGDYFADGLTEALTTELGKAQGLRVIASNTAFAHRDRPTLRELSRELGVGLVVTGSVQRHDASVRINASLVNTSDGTTLWSEHFSRQVTDLLTVQNEISENIAGTLSKTVGVAPLAKSLPATRNPEAYDAYLRGLWHFKGRSSISPIVQARVGTWRSAVAEFERAVVLDPEFALARAALASAYTQLFFYDSTDRRFDERAFLEIQRALAIDPKLPEAYLARAQLTWTARNHFPHEAAIKDLRRAVELNANLADAYLELEKVYYHIGLTDKVIAAGEQVQRLDPSQALSSNRTFRALIDARRLERVRVEVDRNGNLGPYARGDALIALGRLQDALQFLSHSKATLSGDAEYDIGALALLGVVYARLEQPKEAERVLAIVIPAAENPTALSHMHHAQFHIGATFGLLGRKADAARWLTRAADEGYPSYPRFSTDQSLAPLKGSPAYEALLVRLRNDWHRWQESL
jgi:TolB-like protein/DNA-binding winged helix-turn-helix (wHTH) protein/tetratricopeptide (TPR) repeat protein